MLSARWSILLGLQAKVSGLSLWQAVGNPKASCDPHKPMGRHTAASQWALVPLAKCCGSSHGFLCSKGEVAPAVVAGNCWFSHIYKTIIYYPHMFTSQEEHDFTTWRQHLPDERRRRFPIDGCHLLEEGHLQQLICHLTMEKSENLSRIASELQSKQLKHTLTGFSPSMNEFQVDPEAVKHTWNRLGISSEEAKHSNIQCRAP